MKWYGFIFLITFFVSGCAMEQEEVCNANDPLNELPWLADLKVKIDSNCKCEEAIFQAVYELQTVFFTFYTSSDCKPDLNINLFNCEGQVIESIEPYEIEKYKSKVHSSKEIYTCKHSN